MDHLGTQVHSKQAIMKNLSTVPDASSITTPQSSGNVNGGNLDDESAHIKELQKNIRNLNKKIANMSKSDAVVAEHSGKSLDELVAAKLINLDQRAAIQKKPALQQQVVQLEEQLVHYKKVDQEYRARSAKEKADLEKALTKHSEAKRAAALIEVRQLVEAEHKEGLSEKFLILSQFLRLAAARRTEEADSTLDENSALEGVLLAIYTGDETAVTAMIKLVQGSDDKTTSVSGDFLDVSYGQIKAAAQAYKPPVFAAEDSDATQDADSDSKASPKPAYVQQEASTMAMEEEAPLANGHVTANESSSGHADLGSSVATITGDSQLDTTNDTNLSLSQEWVSVSRTSTDAEPAADYTPAVVTSSWADDQPEPQAEVAPADTSDGFHQVQRNRGRSDNWRGRGRGDGRGRSNYSQRGENRGRNRGGRGAPASRARRSDEW